MINRILIRVKVVQILYSYLLSRNEFTVDTPPENPSRDRRFGYSVYLDALNLIQELSGFRTNHPDRNLKAIDINPKLRSNRVGRVLNENPLLREITFKHLGNLNLFSDSLQKISDLITSQEVFNDYIKKRERSLDDDVRFWKVILESLFLNNSEFISIFRQSPDFSLTGLHYGIMQAVATLEAYNNASSMFLKAKNDLALSLEKSYDLYLALFVLMIELTNEEVDLQQMAKEKHLASASDLNPNTRFVNNLFIKAISERKEIVDFISKNKFTWLEEPALLSNLLNEIKQSEIYLKYMEDPSNDWEKDCEFWRDIVHSVIMSSDVFDAAIESKSIFWNDDLPTIGTFVMKTIRRFSNAKDANNVKLLPRFKDEEDERFGAQLFLAAVENREQYLEYIDKFLSSEWDSDRLAFMDIVIMTTALAEILNFPNIPLAVTLNEYIEIANTYSTRRSGPFINGILYSVINYLAENGLLKKPLLQNKHD